MQKGMEINVKNTIYPLPKVTLFLLKIFILSKRYRALKIMSPSGAPGTGTRTKMTCGFGVYSSLVFRHLLQIYVSINYVQYCFGIMLGINIFSLNTVPFSHSFVGCFVYSLFFRPVHDDTYILT